MAKPVAALLLLAALAACGARLSAAEEGVKSDVVDLTQASFNETMGKVGFSPTDAWGKGPQQGGQPPTASNGLDVPHARNLQEPLASPPACHRAPPTAFLIYSPITPIHVPPTRPLTPYPSPVHLPR
jgi:hypothetical protein